MVELERGREQEKRSGKKGRILKVVFVSLDNIKHPNTLTPMYLVNAIVAVGQSSMVLRN